MLVSTEEEGGDAGGARSRSPWGRLLLLGLGLLFGIAMAELGTRGVLLARGHSYSAEAAQLEMRTVVNGMTSTLPVALEEEDRGRRSPNEGHNVLHPYLGYSTLFSISRADHFAQQVAAEEGETFDVFLFGGSFTAIFDMHAGEDLTAALQGDPLLAERKVRIHRMADGGVKQPQHLVALAYHLSIGAVPDLVVNLDGYNKIHLTGLNARRGERISWPSVGHWSYLTEGNRPDEESLDLMVEVRLLGRQAKDLVEDTLRTGLHRSVLLGRARLGRLHDLQRQWAQAQDELITHLRTASRDRIENDRRNPNQLGAPPAPDTDPMARLDEAIDLWVDSSLRMHDLCLGAGVPYIHALQPTLHDEGSKPLTDVEVEKGLGEAGYNVRVQTAYPRMRARGEQLVERGVHFVDMTGVFADRTETLYYDRCHVGAKGSRIVAQELAEVILDRLHAR